MGLLEGKRALITGGTTGLGLAVAGRFLAEGARVVITGRDPGLGEQAEQALGPGARFVAADAADPEAVASSVSAAAAHLGGLDVLVNNAGVGVTARLIDTPLADYDRVMNVNVRGCLLYAQHAYPHLARQSRLHDPHRLGRGDLGRAGDRALLGDQGRRGHAGQDARAGRRPGRRALERAVPG